MEDMEHQRRPLDSGNMIETVERVLWHQTYPPTGYVVLSWDGEEPTEISRHETYEAALAAGRALLPGDISVEHVADWEAPE